MDAEVLEERLARFKEITTIERAACQKAIDSRIAQIEKTTADLSTRVVSLDSSIIRLSGSVDNLSTRLTEGSKNTGLMYGFWGIVVKSMIPVILLILTFMFGMKDQQDNIKTTVDAAVQSALSAKSNDSSTAP